MTSPIRIDSARLVKGAKKVLGPMRFGPAVVRGLFETGVEFNGRMKRAAPRDTGAVSNGHRFAVDESRWRTTWYVAGPHAKAALYQHEGTKHKKMPPPKALHNWVRRRLRSAGEVGKKKTASRERQIAGTAFVVARAILRRGGLDANPWMAETLRDDRKKAVALIRKSIARAIRKAS